jgi:hypothetical protein
LFRDFCDRDLKQATVTSIIIIKMVMVIIIIIINQLLISKLSEAAVPTNQES